ncbi:unnamed protein product [Tilletia controversa]|nr:unnamed protein product [Tilletia controversa]
MCAINSRRSDKMLNAASTEAYRSQMRFRHGAVITKGGKLLATGHNHVRTRFSGPLASNDAIVLPFEGAAEVAFQSQSYPNNNSASSAPSSAASSSDTGHPSGSSGSHTASGSSSSSATSTASAQSHSTASTSTSSQSSADTSTSTSTSSSSFSASSNSNSNSGNSGGGGGHSVGQHSFSMHAEMHAITLALRGARPQRHKSHLSIDPHAAALALASSSSFSSSSNTAPSSSSKPKSLRGGLNPAAESDVGKKKKKTGKGGKKEGGARKVVVTHTQSPPSYTNNSSSAAAATAAMAPPSDSGFGAPSPRVRGADMYVVRLLQDAESKARARAKRRALTTGSSTGNPQQQQQHHRTPAGWPQHEALEYGSGGREPKYADSRPCWRCLKWMEWAGIKRVFWTDENGVWEGAKVVQLLYGPFPAPPPPSLSSRTSSDADSDTDTSSGPRQQVVAPSYPAIHITRYEQAAIVQAARAAIAVVATLRVSGGV